MKGDDYSKGRHFWTHFWCGLFVRGGWGAYLCWGEFTGLWGFLGATSAIAVVFAFCAGMWGDPFWYLFLDTW
jgi:hypothetical protein